MGVCLAQIKCAACSGAMFVAYPGEYATFSRVKNGTGAVSGAIDWGIVG